jgi:hypothetical protein
LRLLGYFKRCANNSLTDEKDTIIMRNLFSHKEIADLRSKNQYSMALHSNLARQISMIKEAQRAHVAR